MLLLARGEGPAHEVDERVLALERRESVARPEQELLWDAAQRPYSTPRLVSLAAPAADGPERTVVCTLDPVKENLDISRYLEESDDKDGDLRI